MQFDWKQMGLEATAVALARAAFSADRRAGAAIGASADKVVERVESRWSSLGWGDSSSVRARRSQKGADDPTAFIIVEGGATWQESGTSKHPPRPTVRPEVDSESARLERRLGDAIERLL